MTIGEDLFASISGGSYYDITEPAERDAARRHTTARSKQKEEMMMEEDRSEESEDDDDGGYLFSKAVDKVRKATPRRYDVNSQPTIYVVPKDLTEGTKDAYEPAVVCIGPLYPKTARKEERRRKLEHYKWCCVRKLIVNAGAGPVRRDSWIPEVHEPLLHKCLDRMKDLEPQIRNSYGSISVNAIGGRDKLALMMLLDGSFLLHRLMKYARLAGKSTARVEEEEDDDWTQVFGHCGIWAAVTRDLLLLNNQIPFFILRALFKHLKSRASESEDDVLIAGGLRLFASLRPGPGSRRSSLPIACREAHHLLHLFYLSIDIPNKPRPQGAPSLPQELQGWVPCASELVEAGVTFRAKNKPQQQATSFLDVSFRRGVLEIPPLELYDYSEALFRNLIGFEQTYPNSPGHVTAYAIFMDCLIKTREDMSLLHQSGILVSHMNGERDLSTSFFSRICAQARLFSDQKYLDDVMGDVIRYQNSRLPRLRAALVRNYFSNAAFFLLLLTLLQTLFAVYSCFKSSAPK